jgi:hypothetical protein
MSLKSCLCQNQYLEEMIMNTKVFFSRQQLREKPMEEIEKLFQNGEIDELDYYDRRSQGQPPGNLDRIKYLTLLSAPD